MKIQPGRGEIPAIYTAHHASANYGIFSDRVALDEEQRIRFSDYGTDLTVPTNGIASVVAEESRGLVDLNRSPDDPLRFKEKDYGKPGPNNIWLPGKAPTPEEQELIQQTIYEPYHAAISALLAKQTELTFVVSWDNTAHYKIGQNEAGKDIIMPPIILSNRGDEEKASSKKETTSCDPEFLESLASNLARRLSRHGLPDEVHLNLVYRGGHICRTYSSRRNPLHKDGITAPIQSLQIEYDTAITHDQKTLQPNYKSIDLLRLAFEQAMAKSLKDFEYKL